MATLRARGPRDARKVYIRYQVGEGDARQQFEKRLDGISNASSREAKQELARVERELFAGRDPYPPAAAPTKLGQLLEQWRDSLDNRSARDDKSRLNKHVIPYWRDHDIGDVTIRAIMDWIDVLAELKTTQTQRHVLNLMSRFFDWAIMRDLAQVNPVKMVPSAAKPIARPKARSWLQDDAKLVPIMEALGGDLALMFYLGALSGMRTGEIAGLRMGDLEWVASKGVIRVAHSYAGPLKEDRRNTGKVKWVPAPADIDTVLGPHLEARRAAGAGPDDLVFVAPVRERGRQRATTWVGYLREYIDAQWDARARAVAGDLTWYEATRHTFVSRGLNAGEALDEVSAAVGHASVETTRRHYAHMLPRTYSPGLRRGLN